MSNRRPDVGSYDLNSGNEDNASRLDDMNMKYDRSNKKNRGSKLDHQKPIVPIVSIDLPD